MRISKGKTPPSPRSEKAAKAKPRAKTEQPAETRVEQALLDEIGGAGASLKAIVERVLGAGDDSEVQALVKKIAKGEHVETAPGYQLPDDE